MSIGSFSLRAWCSGGLSAAGILMAGWLAAEEPAKTAPPIETKEAKPEAKPTEKPEAKPAAPPRVRVAEPAAGLLAHGDDDDRHRDQGAHGDPHRRPPEEEGEGDRDGDRGDDQGQLPGAHLHSVAGALAVPAASAQEPLVIAAGAAPRLVPIFTLSTSPRLARVPAAPPRPLRKSILEII